MRMPFRRGVSSFGLTFFILIILATCVSAQNMFRKMSDYDGDGKADFAVMRFENGNYHWWIWQTTAGLKVQPWGIAVDRPAPGDYDGDGKADIAVWRPPGNDNASSNYYVLQSQTNSLKHNNFFNFIISTMAHQDYNGDGKTDAAVITGHGPGYWLYGNYSGSGGVFEDTLDGFGLRLGDMDGDGRADVSSYNGNNQPIMVTMKNQGASVSRVVRFGLEGDRFQMADFDGDGKGDLTVWRPSDGNWWWIRSSDNVVNVVSWGMPNDTPVPADYDGDGKTDIAIYRRGTDASPQSYYWIIGSQSGVQVFQWGSTTDAAVSYSN